MISLLIISTITPILGSFGLVSSYTYASETQEITGTGVVKFNQAMGSFVVAINSDHIISDERAIKIKMTVGALTKETSLEIE